MTTSKSIGVGVNDSLSAACWNITNWGGGQTGIMVRAGIRADQNCCMWFAGAIMMSVTEIHVIAIIRDKTWSATFQTRQYRTGCR